MSTSAFADLVEERRSAIVRRFVDADRRDGAATALPDDVLSDSLHEFLGELIVALRNPGAALDRSPSASEHGAQRFGLGYDIGSVVREYSLVRELLFDLAEESGTPLTVADQRTLAKFLVHGIADAATEYGLARDEELRRQTQKHIAFLAHELRNPLASARLALGLAKERGDLRSSPVIDSITRSLGRMAGVLDDSLVSIRLNEVGDLQYETFDVAELLAQLVADISAEVAAKSQTVAIHGNASLCADRRALGSALSNLVRNAVKFSAIGGAIHLRVKGVDASVVIEVEDACGGLAAGAAKKVFDPFVQLGGDRSGFGLGLAIAEQAARAHRGTLRVHDLPGHGCVFVLNIPSHPPDPPSRPRSSPGH